MTRDMILLVAGAALAVGGGWLEQVWSARRSAVTRTDEAQRETIRQLQDAVQVVTKLADRASQETLRTCWALKRGEPVTPSDTDELDTALADVERHLSRVADDQLRGMADMYVRRVMLLSLDASAAHLDITTEEKLKEQQKKVTESRRKLHDLAGEALRQPAL